MLNGSRAASVSAKLDGSEKSLKGGLSPAQPGQKPLNWMALLLCHRAYRFDGSFGVNLVISGFTACISRCIMVLSTIDTEPIQCISAKPGVLSEVGSVSL